MASIPIKIYNETSGSQGDEYEDCLLGCFAV
jgi:hypothetical protein